MTFILFLFKITLCYFIVCLNNYTNLFKFVNVLLINNYEYAALLPLSRRDSPSKEESPASARRREKPSGSNSNSNLTPNKITNLVDEEILIEKEKHIRELQETVQILELKVAKLEQLVRLKDNKIQKLMTSNGGGGGGGR